MLLTTEPSHSLSLSLFKGLLLYFNILNCVYVCGHEPAMVSMQRSEEKLFLSFYHVGLRNKLRSLDLVANVLTHLSAHVCDKCVYVHDVYACLSVYAPQHSWGQSERATSHAAPCLLACLSQALSWLGSICQANCQASFQGFPSLYLPADSRSTGIADAHHPVITSVGAGNPDSGPHACITSALLRSHLLSLGLFL